MWSIKLTWGVTAFVCSISSGLIKDKCSEWEASVVAPIILFSVDIFLSATQHLFHGDQSQTRRDRTLSLIPSRALMQQKCVIAELAPTSFCSHSKLAHLLALPLRLCLLQWPLCKVSLSGFCCLCETESAYFNNKGGVVGPTLLFPWYSVKYRCLLRQALLCREWDNVLFIP